MMYQQYLQQGISFRESTFLNNKPILREYDIIIFGAGPGSSVVANSLFEWLNWTILVLESGQDESIYTDIPGAAEFVASTDYN